MVLEKLLSNANLLASICLTKKKYINNLFIRIYNKHIASCFKMFNTIWNSKGKHKNKDMFSYRDNVKK